jgi:hypothetical protein
VVKKIKSIAILAIKMWKDPIVEEIRNAGAKLAEECEYNLHAFAEMLRQHQKEAHWPTVSVDYVRKPKSAKVRTAPKPSPHSRI